MTIRQQIMLFLLGSCVALIVAQFQPAPGYMDADYYYAGGYRLARGSGFTDVVLWNYLENPSGLPHPSHGYWMPLTSIVTAILLTILGVFQFEGVQIGFAIFAGFIPPLTATLTYSINQNKNLSLMAGILAAFPAFYLPFLPTTDTFVLNMLIGGIFFYMIGKGTTWGSKEIRRNVILPLIFGILAGLMHLSRADGLIWFALAMFVIWRLQKPGFNVYLYVILGYLLIMTPWFLRNISIFGLPIAHGGGRVLWLTQYDDIFVYPAELLSPDKWLATGFSEIVQARIWALGVNLQRTLAEQGEIFLLPLILLGLWEKRTDLRVQVGVLAWCLIFLEMTIFLPFVGARGGLFHSAASLQPLFWAVVPIGLRVFIDAGNRIRGWNINQAQDVFAIGLIGLSIILSAVLVFQRVIGSNPTKPLWGSQHSTFLRLERVIENLGAEEEDIVMVGNPPGYYNATGRSAIVIPNGNIQMLLRAANRYQARYVLLDSNYPKGLNELYKHPVDRPGLKFLKSVGDTHIFRVRKQW